MSSFYCVSSLTRTTRHRGTLSIGTPPIDVYQAYPRSMTLRRRECTLSEIECKLRMGETQYNALRHRMNLVIEGPVALITQ
jgi:hypothetical protein